MNGPESTAIAFGPIPSRRLGQSLGVNNIPPKACSFNCVYCQVGATHEPTCERRAFYPVERIVTAVRERLEQVEARGGRVDFLTFVPDGEPTLDVHLGAAIDALRPLGRRIAVITNASLIDRADVRAELGRADWVSLKVDAVDEPVWRRVDRPAHALDLAAIHAGMRAFARDFRGTLTTETMLVRGLNDATEALAATASFVASLAPETAYIAVPTRPTAVPGALPPDEATVTRAWAVFAQHVARVELLTGFEGTGFGATGDAEADVLATTAVHPMRTAQLEELLRRDGCDWSVVEALLQRRLLARVEYGGHAFYVRSFAAPRPEN